MASDVQIRIAVDVQGWRVTMTDGRSRPVDGRVPNASVERLWEAIAPLGVAPRVMVPGQDVAATSQEDAVSRALAAALADSGDAWGHLQMLRGRVEGRGEQLVVVIDAEDADVRGLPWELLALGDGGVESVRGGLVVRLADGPAPRPTQRPTVALFAADADPDAASLLAKARAHVAAAGLKEVALADHPAVVHVVAHGQKGSGAVAVALDDGALLHPGTVSARLGEAVATAHLVILGVCHGGNHEVDALRGVSGRLLAGGAAIVVAPRRAVATEAVDRFSAGIYAALGAGQSAGSAVAAGRRAVRAWGHPHPGSRWWVWACWTSGVDALEVAPRPLSWVPPGWPLPSPEASLWIDAARLDAIRRADGYVGVEHLLRSLTTTDGGGVDTSALRRSSGKMLDVWNKVSGALGEQLPSSSEPGLSPRLVSWGRRLHASFEMDDLANVMMEGQSLPAAMGPAPPGIETLFTDENEAGSPALALQVLGGPEDGRVLRLEVGQTLGRAGGQADVELFRGTRLTDRKLSRQHCRWIGPSKVNLERSGVVVRGDSRHRLEGEVELRSGDVLILSEGTRLLAMGDVSSE